MGAVVIAPLPHPVDKKDCQEQGRFAPRHYPASSLLPAPPSPCRLRSPSRFGGYRTYLAPVISQPGRRGLLQLLGVSLPSCRRYHPAEVDYPYQPVFGYPCCLRPTDAGSTFGVSHFRGHLCVHFRCSLTARHHPFGDVVDGLQDIGFRHPAILAICLLAFDITGLTPAGHICLSWTHIRT